LGIHQEGIGFFQGFSHFLIGRLAQRASLFPKIFLKGNKNSYLESELGQKGPQKGIFNFNWGPIPNSLKRAVTKLD